LRKGWHSISKMILGCLLLLASAALAQEQPGNPEYSWLNGKWKGRSLSNAPFEMELRVMNDNEVKGSGVLQDRQTGRLRPVAASIAGVVKGTKVTLDVDYGGTDKYKLRFSYVDGKLRLKRKNDEVDYDKIE